MTDFTLSPTIAAAAITGFALGYAVALKFGKKVASVAKAAYSEPKAVGLEAMTLEQIVAYVSDRLSLKKAEDVATEKLKALVAAFQDAHASVNSPK